MDEFATHGLSCRFSRGHHSRHAAVNDIVQRSLAAAKVPSHLEPSGLYRSDGKRPDGATIVPWKMGKLLVWDVTCVDTLAPSHRVLATRGAGVVADEAEHHKKLKYSNLDSTPLFTPVAIETLGAMGKEALSFLKELGYRILASTCEPQAYQLLVQRGAVAVQRGNAAAVLGTCSAGDGVFSSIILLT